LPLRERARASVRVRARRVSGPRGSPRRQGRLEAARPQGGRRRRRSARGPGAARRGHVGRLHGGPRADMTRAAHPGATEVVRAAVPEVATLVQRLGEVDYLADDALATSLFFALRLPQPLLLEGEAGVGKTEAAKALAEALGTRLIRLQCYEGID